MYLKFNMRVSVEERKTPIVFGVKGLMNKAPMYRNSLILFIDVLCLYIHVYIASTHDLHGLSDF